MPSGDRFQESVPRLKKSWEALPWMKLGREVSGMGRNGGPYLCGLLEIGTGSVGPASEQAANRKIQKYQGLPAVESCILFAFIFAQLANIGKLNFKYQSAGLFVLLFGAKIGDHKPEL